MSRRGLTVLLILLWRQCEGLKSGISGELRIPRLFLYLYNKLNLGLSISLLNFKERLMKKFLIFLSIAIVAGCFLSCNDALVDDYVPSQGIPINLSASLQQQNLTRANDQGFVTGDRMGIYIVDYAYGNKPGTLTAYDNRANNMLYTFDANGNCWKSKGEIYWRDETTPIDVYGYYPGVNTISDVNAYAFEVEADQSIAASDGNISSYEASDFLWGKATKVTPTSETVTITYHHQLAGVQVQLVMGTGVTEAEWEKLPKTVLVENTVRTADIDLSTGVVSRRGETVEPILMAAESGDNYRAVVVPQAVLAGKTLLSLTLDGISYTHTLTTAMDYQAGKLHRFTITVNKRTASGEYEISVSSDGVTDWVNDESSHDFTQNAYLVVHVPEAGQLEKVMKASFPNYAEVKNLKITGEMKREDFTFLKEQIPNLAYINIQDVKLRKYTVINGDTWKETHYDDCLHNEAFYGMENLRGIVLPSTMKKIMDLAIRDCKLTSTLVIPEGVTYVGQYACEGVSVQLPYTLEVIDRSAFEGAKIIGGLRFTNKLKQIGGWAFAKAEISGVFSLPPQLEVLGPGAFENCGGDEMTGVIEIPQTVTEIPMYAFNGIKFKGNKTSLFLHDNITSIGIAAFGTYSNYVWGNPVKFDNPIFLPKSLKEIGEEAFIARSILSIPEHIERIGPSAFRYANIKEISLKSEFLAVLDELAFQSSEIEKITFSDNVLSVERQCFKDCSMLQYAYLGKNIERIGEQAFEGCGILHTLICLAPYPPRLDENAFNGVYFDKCILQVPEASVSLYQNTEGWNKFKNITAYREFAFDIPEIKCLDKGYQREGILRTEGAWRVVECPDWVKVSPLSGSDEQRKWDVTVTVDPMPHTAADREGRIVFQLEGKDYTTYTTVKQYGYEYPEEMEIVLQKASAGAPREIPLFLLGEGFDAEEIANGCYLQLMREQMEHLFAIEPYKTYRNYFSVYTTVSRASETGVSWEDNRFELNIDQCGDLCGNLDVITNYVDRISPSINSENLPRTTILLLINQDMAKCHAEYADDGRTVVYCALSPEPYPYDQRGYLQHSLGGLGFGKLGKEYVTHMDFIQGCTSSCCNGWEKYKRAKGFGYYENLTHSGRMNEAPWYDLMFHPKYSAYIDMYDGAYGHLRGMWRSENESVMNTFIPYFNTVSRRAIVKRIKEYAGETYSFEDFVANDKIEIPE